MDFQWVRRTPIREHRASTGDQALSWRSESTYFPPAADPVLALLVVDPLSPAAYVYCICVYCIRAQLYRHSLLRPASLPIVRSILYSIVQYREVKRALLPTMHSQPTGSCAGPLARINRHSRDHPWTDAAPIHFPPSLCYSSPWFSRSCLSAGDIYAFCLCFFF